MNKNKISEKVHANAKNKGFWDEKNSKEHCLALVFTEISEMIECDRKNERANKAGFNEWLESPICFHQIFKNAFEKHIKDTVEDEMADVVIRLADLAGSIHLDFDKMQPCNYNREFGKYRFTENAYGLIKGLTNNKFCIERRIVFGMHYIESWSKELNINLEWHIEQKMKYNELRDKMHGKKY